MYPQSILNEIRLKTLKKHLNLIRTITQISPMAKSQDPNANKEKIIIIV